MGSVSVSGTDGRIDVDVVAVVIAVAVVALGCGISAGCMPEIYVDDMGWRVWRCREERWICRRSSSEGW